MKKSNIIIADDHGIVRDGLQNLIRGCEEFSVISVCRTGKEIFASPETLSGIDIVILDLRMPEMDGFEAAERLRDQYPNIRVIILSMYDRDGTIIRLLRLDVRAILKKDMELNKILDVLRAVARGEYYYGSPYSGKIASFFGPGGGTSERYERAHFNDKEINFMRLATTDIAYKSMADELGLKAGTMNDLRKNVFNKLGVKNRVSVAIYAIRNGFVGL